MVTAHKNLGKYNQNGYNVIAENGENNKHIQNILKFAHTNVFLWKISCSPQLSGSKVFYFHATIKPGLTKNLLMRVFKAISVFITFVFSQILTNCKDLSCASYISFYDMWLSCSMPVYKPSLTDV